MPRRGQGGRRKNVDHLDQSSSKQSRFPNGGEGDNTLLVEDSEAAAAWSSAFQKGLPIHQGGGYKHGEVWSHESMESESQGAGPILHSSGGRPWTMYRRSWCEDAIHSSRASEVASPDNDGEEGTSAMKDPSSQSSGAEGRKEAQGSHPIVGVRGKSRALKLVSYNILAESLVSLDYIPYCAGWNKEAWDARRGRVLAKILEFDPDIICLQEVDDDLYVNFFKKKLRQEARWWMTSLLDVLELFRLERLPLDGHACYSKAPKKNKEAIGYAGSYFRRSGDKKDGCATFVVKKDLRVVHEECVPFNVPGHPVLDRDNVALLLVVDALLPPLAARKEGSDGVHVPQTAAKRQRNRAFMPEMTPSACLSSSDDIESFSVDTSSDPLPSPPASCAPGDDGSSPVDSSTSSPPGSRARCDEHSTATSSVDSPPPHAGGDKGSPTDSDVQALPTCPAGVVRVVIGNTHLLFNPKRGDVKTAQLMLLTDRVERLSKHSKADGVVICGDFNMTPDSALYHYMVEGELDVHGLNRHEVAGQCHSLGGKRFDQRRMVSNCVSQPFRRANFKHQGSGCTLGSFRRACRTRTDGKAPSSCSICCTRLPDAAAAAYVMPSDPLGRLVLPPPSATGGSYFAVMDPNPCSCNERTSLVLRGQAGDNSVRSKNEDGSLGKGKGKRKEKRSPEADDATSVPPKLFPPVLWPHLGGGNLANSRQYGKLMHGLRLRSAYAQQSDAWGTGEPAFTSFHHLFKGTVDYVFYGPGHMGGSTLTVPEGAAGELGEEGRPSERSRIFCVGVAEPPLLSELSLYQGIPSPMEPSDHIPLAVYFEVVRGGDL